MCRVVKMIRGGKEREWVGQQQQRVFESFLFAANKFSCQMGQQEKQKYRGLKDENRTTYLMIVVFVVPGPEEKLCAEVCDRAESAPVLEESQCSGVEHEEIHEKRSILVSICVKQRRSEQAANQRHD